jgi:hypothetical protein
LPKRSRSSDAAIDPLAATIVTTIRLGAAAVQAPVDPVTLAVESIRGALVSSCICAA